MYYRNVVKRFVIEYSPPQSDVCSQGGLYCLVLSVAWLGFVYKSGDAGRGFTT